MKTTLLLLSTIVFFTAKLQSQNLFSNPDFETYSSCPIDQNEVFKATGWVSIVQSPDYMNCSYSCWTGQTIIGAQSGTGYMGFASYMGPGATEAIAQQLSVPLVAGTSYTISLYAKRSSGPAYTNICNGVCFYGWTGNPFGVAQPVGICPEDSGGTVLACTDTVINTLWQPYTVNFVAPANYDFIGIAVGCNTGSGCGEYVFIDNLNFILSSVSENSAAASELKVFQDHNRNYLNVAFNLLKNSDISFSLVDMVGQNVFESQKKLNGGKVNEQFDISTVSNGIYFLRLESEKFQLVRKVFISK